jgi:hypothetical protein
MKKEIRWKGNNKKKGKAKEIRNTKIRPTEQGIKKSQDLRIRREGIL